MDDKFEQMIAKLHELNRMVLALQMQVAETAGQCNEVTGSLEALLKEKGASDGVSEH